MRLSIVTDAWSPQINGVAKTYEALSDYLAKHSVLNLITPQSYPTVPLPTYPEVRLSLATPYQIYKRIRDFEPDIVHIATEGPLGILARKICINQNIPFTTCYHTRFPEYIRRRIPIPESWTYGALKAFHNAAQRMLVATEGLAQELEGKGFQHVTVWRRGIDLTPFEEAPFINLRMPRPIFLYVGRLALDKNIDAFLQLDLPGSKVVVGDGPDRNRLQSLFPKAHFLGSQTGIKLGAIYKAADCFVFPSKTDTYGLVAAGTPVACFPGYSAQEIFGGDRCGVANEDLRFAALSALRISRELCANVGRRHSLESSAIHLLSILKEAQINYAASTSDVTGALRAPISPRA
jgi:glycosyltransferase involved in cell wall biosynthesis